MLKIAMPITGQFKFHCEPCLTSLPNWAGFREGGQCIQLAEEVLRPPEKPDLHQINDLHLAVKFLIRDLDL